MVGKLGLIPLNTQQLSCILIGRIYYGMVLNKNIICVENFLLCHPKTIGQGFNTKLLLTLTMPHNYGAFMLNMGKLAVVMLSEMTLSCLVTGKAALATGF